MKVAALVLVLMLMAPRAFAHDFRPGVLSLHEREPGSFVLAWVEPVDSNAPEQRVEPSFPAHCQRRTRMLRCAAPGLHGAIAFTGLPAHMRVVVSIRWRDGRALERVVTGHDPRMPIAPARGGAGWLRLGAEHVLGGFDHLAFLLGLLLLSKRDRRLVLTVTAFTMAHSFTLALAVLDVVALPSAPVEATIAASVVLVAREALRERPTATRRAPWAVALLFGLVHGLGFAGALRDAGLSGTSVGWPLFWFNLGVELAQLAVVALVVVAQRAGLALGRSRRLAAYVLGTLGALWLVQRLAAIVFRV